MKYHIAKLEDVPEAIRNEYTPAPNGQGFVLKVEDLNVNELSTARERAEQERQNAQTEAQNTAREIAEMRKQLAKQTEAQKQLQARLYETTVGQKATEAFLKAGGNEKALPFVIGQIRETYKYNENGEITAVGSDGKPIVDKDGKPLTIDQYIKDVVSVQHDYLFKPSQGGGASGSAVSTIPGGLGKNPFDPKTRDWTEANRIAVENPALAKQLAKAVGIDLNV